MKMYVLLFLAAVISMAACLNLNAEINIDDERKTERRSERRSERIHRRNSRIHALLTAHLGVGALPLGELKVKDGPIGDVATGLVLKRGEALEDLLKRGTASEVGPRNDTMAEVVPNNGTIAEVVRKNNIASSIKAEIDPTAGIASRFGLKPFGSKL
ncbi:uncharacterized protein LOC106640801 [Copidosoma floridanum]|uniref:uncharacterized protein LOC106640801 n=1 Tax=Copidosoma floridanum TaxID=29053 RepID=UPI0006C9D9E7|nr:uncharacterized protein LOC106640801 [Copidosoma floridanum]